MHLQTTGAERSQYLRKADKPGYYNVKAGCNLCIFLEPELIYCYSSHWLSSWSQFRNEIAAFPFPDLSSNDKPGV